MYGASLWLPSFATRCRVERKMLSYISRLPFGVHSIAARRERSNLESKTGLKRTPAIFLQLRQPVKPETPLNHRKIVSKIFCAGLVEVYESPAQIGFPGIASPLHLGPHYGARRSLLSGCVEGVTELFGAALLALLSMLFNTGLTVLLG